MASCKYKKTNKVLGYGKYGTSFEVEFNSKKYAMHIFEDNSDKLVYSPENKFDKFQSYRKYTTFSNPNEIDIPFKFRSPNIMSGEYIAEINECDYNAPAIVTRLIDNDLISNLQKLTFEEKKNIVRGIVKGIQCFHNNKYLYLNCSLQNCIYKKEGRGFESVIINYVNSAFAKEGVEKGIFTQQNRIPDQYKPPESLSSHNGKYFYTNKSDIWSLGMLIYRIFTNNFEIFFESIYNDMENTDYSSLKKFYSEFMNEKVIDDFISEIIIPRIGEIHSEIELPENKGQLKAIFLATLQSNPSKRSNIDAIANLPFFNIPSEPSICTVIPYQKLSLVKTDPKLFSGVFDIINLCRERFPDKCIGVLFLALDMYLRYIATKNVGSKNIAETCCLCALKYYYWSEFNELTADQQLALQKDEFIVREVKLYKDLEGKVNEERYFNNAKSKKELVNVYETFIFPSTKDSTLVITDKDNNTFEINKQIINYLLENPVDFFKRLDYKRVDNLNELTISSFFYV